MSLHISYLCYWGLKLKNYPVLGVKRKSRKRSLTAGKYFGCSSYYLSLGPMSSWSDMSIFIKCFSGPGMAKTGVGKGFRLHRGHLDHRLLQLELLRRVSPLLEILLHVNSWTLYNKIFFSFCIKFIGMTLIHAIAVREENQKDRLSKPEIPND